MLKSFLDKLIDKRLDKTSMQKVFYEEMLELLMLFADEPEFDDSVVLRELMDEFNAYVDDANDTDEGFVEVASIIYRGDTIRKLLE